MNHRAPLTLTQVCAGLILVALLLSSVILLSSSPSNSRRITVYSPIANYSLPVIEHSRHDYVGLLETLEPLGRVTSRRDGPRWRLRFKDIDAQFTAGSGKSRVGRRDLVLAAPFILQNERGLVPVESLATLLPLFLEGPVTFHTAARRLFIQETGTTYSAEYSNTAGPKLALIFSAPVNPTIHTEPGKLSMLFTRDPVVASGAPSITFNDNSISSAVFEESNGSAEITVRGTVPLMASFSNNGRTITIAPAPSASTAQASPAQPPTAQSTIPGSSTGPAAGLPTQSRHFVVAIDASHGGDERGAALTDNLSEKDVALTLARRIRLGLEMRGVNTLMVRDGDTTLTADQRASLVNSAHASLYLGLHAANDGTGIRVYSPLVPNAGENRGPFVSWDMAQTAALPSSRNLATALAAALNKTVTTRTLAASLQPLNHIQVPAVALELAPRQPGIITDLNSPEYQERVASSVVAAIVAARASLGGGQ